VNVGIGQGRRRGRPRRAGIPAAVAGIILLVAACSGGRSAGSSASSAAAAASPSAGDSSGSSSAGRPAANQKQLAYSECMQKHGVPGVPISLPGITPDPGHSSGRHWNAAPVGGPAPGSPRFLAAQQACRSLVPPPRWVPG
jgi:hypothetical protein